MKTSDRIQLAVVSNFSLSPDLKVFRLDYVSIFETMHRILKPRFLDRDACALGLTGVVKFLIRSHNKYWRIIIPTI